MEKMSRKAIESMTSGKEFMGSEVDMASERNEDVYGDDSEIEDEDGESGVFVFS